MLVKHNPRQLGGCPGTPSFKTGFLSENSPKWQNRILKKEISSPDKNIAGKNEI